MDFQSMDFAVERADLARAYRDKAADLARNRPLILHSNNGDEARYKDESYLMSFTKGLEHDPATGLVLDPEAFEAFRTAINNGNVVTGTVEPFSDTVPSALEKERPWEAPTAGWVHDLQGPDSQAVTMPPAPALGSDELTYEIAEVYELALLRDVPFAAFSDQPHANTPDVQASLNRLNDLPYTDAGFNGRPRMHDNGQITPQLAFRGSASGAEVGPYISQFLLMGTPDYRSGGKEAIQDGRLQYGAQIVDQRVAKMIPQQDFMTTRDSWLEAQNGANLRKNDVLFGGTPSSRFITTPRDLACYVHDDALYQAYLNACLILLDMKAPFDPAFDALSGAGMTPSGKAYRRAGGFALWGGPHILSLVTEVATRALKAVRWQKFNIHRRLRPEALAARMEYLNDIPSGGPGYTRLVQMHDDLAPTLAAIQAHNAQQNGTCSGTQLLPMAFQEGSPMHPSYGAGHATVAGACVTILKAYFDEDAKLVAKNGAPAFRTESGGAWAYVPSADGNCLEEVSGLSAPLTVGGELNKLAANISIGRNMAGVHYFADYYDSARMGEKIAIGILEEQAMGYPHDEFKLSLTSFDGDTVEIGRSGAFITSNVPFFS